MSQQPVTETGQTEQAGQAVQTPPPSVARAEQLMTEWGQRVGLFIGMTRRRLQHATTSLRDEVGNMDQPKQVASAPAPSSPTSQPLNEQEQGTGQLVTQHAEQLVDGFAQRVSALAAATGLHIQRADAFIREDAEDFWAEAQSIRTQRRFH